MSTNKKVIVKTYKGDQSKAQASFKKDAEALSRSGYTPVSQSWSAGNYEPIHFVFALLACFILIGFFIFIYMLIVKPDGTLTVQYEYNEVNDPVRSRKCPKCSEYIIRTAKICRYCRTEITPKYVDNNEANVQIIKIEAMYRSGLDLENIASELNSARDYMIPDNKRWKNDDVKMVINNFFSD